MTVELSKTNNDRMSLERSILSPILAFLGHDFLPNVTGNLQSHMLKPRLTEPYTSINVFKVVGLVNLLLILQVLKFFEFSLLEMKS